MSKFKKLMLESITTFSTDIYDQAIGQQNDTLKNLFMSPVSIYTALSMTLVGSDGETRKELKQALRVPPTVKDSELMAAFGSIIQTYFWETKGVEVSLANKLFVENKLDINSKFSKQLAAHMKSSEERVDFKFHSEQARQQINSWVSEATKNKIRDLLPEGSVTSASVLAIVNALYFKGFWKEQFDESVTFDADFCKLDGTTKRVKMMYQRKTFPMIRLSELGVVAMKFPFRDSNWSMLIVLPNDYDGLKIVTDHLRKPGCLASLISRQFIKMEAEVFLPRFQLSESDGMNLKPMFENMGVKTLFNEQANLKNIANNVENLFVSDIFHKAMLEVDEQGARAAAATAVMSVKQCYVERLVFRVDHPFFVALICDDAVPVFFGHVTDPKDL